MKSVDLEEDYERLESADYRRAQDVTVKINSRQQMLRILSKKKISA